MKPYPWHTVTGSDFARSIRWARTQPTLRDILRPIQPPTPTKK